MEQREMTERKFTDEEVIKALECCINDNCDNCPDTFGNCEHNAMRNALDLIKRQKAEIDILVRKHDTLLDELADKQAKIKKVKSCLEFYLDNNEEMGVVFIPKFVVENRIQEMTEDK